MVKKVVERIAYLVLSIIITKLEEIIKEALDENESKSLQNKDGSV